MPGAASPLPYRPGLRGGLALDEDRRVVVLLLMLFERSALWMSGTAGGAALPLAAAALEVLEMLAARWRCSPRHETSPPWLFLRFTSGR